MDETQIGLEDPNAEFGNASEQPTREEKVLERFGNDPDQVVKGYINLEAKLAEQGAELGDLRKAVANMAQAPAESQPQSKASDPMSALQERLAEAEENGGLSVNDLASEILGTVNALVDQRMQGVESTVKDMSRGAAFGSLVGGRDDAEQITAAVQEILQEDPTLLPDDLSPDAANQRMKMLVQLAEARAGGTRKVRPGAESGVSRVHRRRGGSSNAEDVDKLAQKFHETNLQTDLTELTRQILARRKGGGTDGRF